MRGDVREPGAVEREQRRLDRRVLTRQVHGVRQSSREDRHLGATGAEARAGQQRDLVGRRRRVGGPDPLGGRRRDREGSVGQGGQQRPRDPVQPGGGYDDDRTVGEQPDRVAQERVLESVAEIAWSVGATACAAAQQEPRRLRHRECVLRGSGDLATDPAPVDHEHVQLAVDVHQLHQRSLTDASHESVDVETLDVVIGSFERVVLGTDPPLQPGALLLDRSVGSPSARDCTIRRVTSRSAASDSRAGAFPG